jgi:hypothetical protein
MDRNVKNLLFPVCSGDFPPKKVLSQPGSCSSQHDLRAPRPTAYNGPRVNKSIMPVTPKDQVLVISAQHQQALDSTPVPDSWSWKDRGGNMIEDGSRNQGGCGCCWAMAVVSALSDRYAIKYKIANQELSAVPLISCGGAVIGSNMGPEGPCDGCGGTASNAQCTCGGSAIAAGLWLESIGSTRLESCWPFTTVGSGDSPYVAPECPGFAFDPGSDCCLTCCGTPAAAQAFTVEKGSTHAIIARTGQGLDIPAIIRAIKLDVMANGPIVTSFWLPKPENGHPAFEEDWVEYAGTGKVFIPSTPRSDGRHSVVITGWGHDDRNNVDYWEMRNTWGEVNGPGSGYYRFAMSTSVPKAYWTGVDIPIDYSGDGNYAGGAVSMTPGKLPKGSWGKGNGGGPVGLGWKPQPGKPWPWLRYGWVAIGILVLIILIVLLL